MLGPRYYLERAREYPILGTWVIANWQESRITPVVVARRQAEDRVLIGNCLVDISCLGIKNAYSETDISPTRFQRELPDMFQGEPEECSVALAHEIIYGGLEYAARYGFQPHRDFTASLVDKVLDPPDAHPRTHNVKFGRDGKPFYVAGPYDDERKSRSVINTLMRTAGEGNFDYLIGWSSDEFLEEEPDL